MILRKIFLVCLLSVAAFGLHAQQHYVGYTTTDSITTRGAAFGEAGTYPVGAILSPQMLSAYAGCKILGIRIAVSKDLGRARTFIYSIDGGMITPVIEQKQRLYEGWNSVLFNGDGIEIQGNETLFFGFDYTETSEMVEAEEGALCGYGNDVDGGFYTYYDFGQGTRLYSLANVGCLCVQLIVDVSSLPAKDINLSSVDTGFKYKVPGEDIDMMVTYMNAGRDSVKHFQIGCQLDEEVPVFYEQKDTVAPGKTEISLFSFQLPNSVSIGLHQLTIFVSDYADNGDVPTGTGDTLRVNFAVYQNSLQREQTYLEVYTDQTSSYVPYLDKALQYLNDNSSIVTTVNVHKPGTQLSIGTSDYLHDLYAYTWPSFTSNRCYFPGEAHIAYDMNDYLPVIGTEMTANIIGDIAVQDYFSPTFASINVQLDYNRTTRQLQVKTSGELLPEAEAIYGQLALTLMLTEDGVKGSQMQINERTQRIDTNNNYLHNHVLRAYLTSPVGDALETSDNRYETISLTTLDEAWNADKMTVVALLTKRADVSDTDRETLVAQLSDHLLDLDVVNVSKSAIAEATGISSVSCRTTAPARYSLDGKQVVNPHKSGLYIERNTDGRVRKVTIR